MGRVEEAGVPIAMFVGKDDDLGDVKDSQWAKFEITDGWLGDEMLVHYKEYNGGHSTFLVGLDMRYQEDLIPLLSKYNPIPDSIEDIEQDFNQFNLDPVFEKYLN